MEIKNSLVSLNKYVVRRKVDNEMLVVHTRSGLVLTVNDTGAEILSLIKESVCIKDIVSVLCEKYNIDSEQALKDVNEFLSKLSEKDIIYFK